MLVQALYVMMAVVCYSLADWQPVQLSELCGAVRMRCLTRRPGQCVLCHLQLVDGLYKCVITARHILAFCSITSDVLSRPPGKLRCCAAQLLRNFGSFWAVFLRFAR